MLLRAVFLGALAFGSTPALAASTRARGARLDEIERRAVEIETVARAAESARGDDAAAARRGVRGRVEGVGALAIGRGASAEEAWRLLRRLAVSRARYAAVEAVIFLSGRSEERAWRELLAAVPEMTAPIARYASERLLARGRPPARVEDALLDALERTRDIEAKLTLVKCVGRLETLKSARALVAAAPAPAKRSRPLTPSDLEPVLRLRTALAAALATSRAEELRAWRTGPAFDEIASREIPLEVRAARSLVLLGSVRLAPEERARPAVARLVGSRSASIALSAIDALSALDAKPSRAVLDWIARAEGSDPAVAARAAATIAHLDGDAPATLLIALLGRQDWRARQAAAIELARRGRDDAAFRALLRTLRAERARAVRASIWTTLRSFRRSETVAAAIAALEPPRAAFPEHPSGYLRWASGQNHGEDAAAWRAWWAASRAGFRFPSPPGEGPSAADAEAGEETSAEPQRAAERDSAE